MSLPAMDMPSADERPVLLSTLPRMPPNPDQPDPMIWVSYLLRQLESRRAQMRTWDDYYEGRHPLSMFDDDFARAFGKRWISFASNYSARVVNSFAERLEVQGFRFKDEAGDQDLWEIWQENDLDGESAKAHIEALIKGSAYALVQPGEDGTPLITVEDPMDCIVALDPRDRRRRLAGLKRWTDEQGHLVVYLYLPEALVRMRSTARIPDDWTSWISPGATWPATNLLRPFSPDGEDPLVDNRKIGVVPLVPLYNRPRLKGEGRSEIQPIMSNQDAINYFRAMAVVGSRFLAFPQRYIKNFELEIDKATGQPKAPFRAGMQQIWTFGPPPEDTLNPMQVEVGQFAAADMTPFMRLLDSEVHAMAIISGLDYETLMGGPSMFPASGEAKKSGDASTVKKVQAMHLSFGVGWEETMRTALLVMGDDRADIRTAETTWVSPEIRNEAVRTDSIVKQLGSDIIDQELALEQLGYSPEQVRRLMARQAKREADEEAKKAEEPEPPPPTLDQTPPGMAIIPAPTGPRMTALPQPEDT